MAAIIKSRRWGFIACIALPLTLCISLNSKGQSQLDSALSKMNPQKWATFIERKASSIEEKLISKSLKTLKHLQKQEERLYRNRLASKDSSIAKTALSDIEAKYSAMRMKLKENSATLNTSGQYIPKLDTLTTTLKFLKQHGVGDQVNEALKNTLSLQDKLKQTEEIQKFIKERKERLKAQLEKLGIVKQLKKFNKEAYYYSAQVKEYKEVFKDSKKIEKKALELLSKTKLFKDFFRRNSQLASLFRLPGEVNTTAAQASFAGLQTRTQVNNLIQQQIAAGGPGSSQQVSQNIQSAQAQLRALKDKILKAGGGTSSEELPDFKPNSQKTKGFAKRLEYGTNIQTQKATNYFPVTSDVGLSVGYKLNDKSVIGIGVSYKVGWGTGWRDLRLTHQGLGLRSYVDVKLKGSFWLSGGYEQNYRASFNSINQLENLNAWQRSALIGVSKTLSLKTKLFKKTKLQLLWDFLSHDQIPQAQPIVFRIGYSFN